VSVKSSNGTPNSKSTVKIYRSAGMVGLIAQSVTDTSGVATFNDIIINSTTYPLANTATVYILVVAANHQWTETTVTLTGSETVNTTVTLLAHKLFWDNLASNPINVMVGNLKKTGLVAKYSGHDGPTGLNLVVSAPQSPYMGEQVTRNGFPGQFTYTGYDSNMIDVIPNSQSPDEFSVIGKNPGNTQITITASLSFDWSGTPYSLSVSRVVPVVVANNTQSFVADITPAGTLATPSSPRVYQVTLTQNVPDIQYTWTVTGSGMTSFQTETASGQITANGSGSAQACRVSASGQLGSFYTIAVDAYSPSLNQHS
jgi:hypothetical protein